MVKARNLRMHLPYVESCEKKFTMREIYSISCMKEGNVQINYLHCRMVCCTPFPELDKIRGHDSDSHSHTHLIVTVFSPSKITKKFKYVKQIGITF